MIGRFRHVNVQLANGALVEDPEELVEGTGKRVRHVKLRSMDDDARRQRLDVSGTAGAMPLDGRFVVAKG